MSFDRSYIAEVARTWLGTPYHHQAALKGVGADCIGLVRGVYKELYGHDPSGTPRYSESWGEVNPDELLLKGARDYLEEVWYSNYKLGDVLIFRVKNAASAKHCSIVSGHDTMIHAVSTKAVIETNIGAWSKKIAGVFQFPGVVEWQS